MAHHNILLASVAAVAAVVAGQSATVTVDETKAALVYDGHGALSAGASSRLLYDYDEPYRSDILDLLFKPNYGGALHHVKVEIGGDGQSTDGTEASHMHYRDDLSCQRPYEFWLLSEARKRNPAIKTYALSWASPYWVGNQTSYYSDDEISYHMSWLNCTREWDIGTIDYIGNWNERPWGPPDWTKQYRKAMDDIGFAETKIIIPDGGDVRGIEAAFQQDAEFEAAVDGLGVHYPCNHPAPELITTYNKKYWSSEDYSTVGDWAGAACWGRLLNQNFVRMNQTSTISWSLIWSVYNPGFPYFGNGLMYAMTPWSNFYEAGQPGSSNGGAIWTNAHTGQFSEPGWQYLPVSSGGAGMLPSGGSFVTLVQPGGKNFTVVLEKLEGRCLRCAGQTTEAETVAVKLSPNLAATVSNLQAWLTNETVHFVRLPDIRPVDGSFTVTVPKDSIVTVSSWFNGQSKAAVTIPPYTPFPTTHSETFDKYPVDGLARYFADNGGSFQVAADPQDPSNMVYKQWVTHENGVNRWGGNVNPISLLGNATWTSVSVTVAVKLAAPTPTPPTPPPPTAPPTQYANLQNQYSGMCLDAAGKQTADGSTVDVWTCVKATNEAFYLDGATSQLIEHNSGKCVSDVGCHPGAGVCLQACAAAPKFVAGPDNTIVKVTSGAKQCLQSSTKNLDGIVVVAACNEPATKQEQWKVMTPGNGPPIPTGAPYAGLCVHTDRGGQGTCLLLDAVGNWTLSDKGTVVASGHVAKDVTAEWTTLKLVATPTSGTVSVDGVASPAAALSKATAGQVSINAGYNVAYFDNFTLADAS